MSTQIISIINNKGGVGKTTSTAIFAELLAYLGKKVLCIDLDGQANLSMMFGQYFEDSKEVIEGIEPPAEQNISDLLRLRYRESEKVFSVIRHTTIQGVDIIPSSTRNKKTPDILNTNQTGNNNIILKRALDTIKDDYDYILIDNAPRSDLLTVNSMFASDYVLVPVRVEKFSYKGLTETLKDIYYIKDEYGMIKPDFLGAFITQVETNTNIYKNTKSEYEEELQDKFFKTAIRKDIQVANMESDFKPILELTPNTNVVFDYAELLLEMGILDEKSAGLLRKTIGY